MDELFTSYEAKAFPELIDNLQFGQTTTFEQLVQPMKVVKVGAFKQCVGYMLKPSFAITWRHLHAKAISFGQFRMDGNATSARDTWIYQKKFCPNHKKPDEWVQ